MRKQPRNQHRSMVNQLIALCYTKAIEYIEFLLDLKLFEQLGISLYDFDILNFMCLHMY